MRPCLRAIHPIPLLPHGGDETVDVFRIVDVELVDVSGFREPLYRPLGEAQPAPESGADHLRTLLLLHIPLYVAGRHAPSGLGPRLTAPLECAPGRA